MPEPEGERLELIGGEIVSMSFGHIPHEVVKKNVTKILVLWLAQNSPAELFAESMYHIDEHNCAHAGSERLVSGTHWTRQQGMDSRRSRVSDRSGFV